MFELIRANRRRAAGIVAALGLLLLVLGFVGGELLSPGAGLLGAAVALLAWAGLFALAWLRGDAVLLASSGARRVEHGDHPVLWNVVEEMRIASGLEHAPAIYLIDEDAPNAFATGRSPERASIAVTAGLLERLDRDELQGVVAHEIGHVHNRDVLYLTVAGVMVGAIVLLADRGSAWLRFGGARRRTAAGLDGQGRPAGRLALALGALFLMLAAPLFSRLLYLALSRRREYLADASAALFTRYPEGLASALEKISDEASELRAANRVTAPMYVVNPLRRRGRAIAWLSTHPPTEERIRILRTLAGAARVPLDGSEPAGVGLAAYDRAYRRVTRRPVGVVPPGARRSAQIVPARSERGGDERSHARRVREATDALWRLRGYRFVACPCGTTLKVPAGPREIACPHCGEQHRVSTA